MNATMRFHRFTAAGFRKETAVPRPARLALPGVLLLAGLVIAPPVLAEKNIEIDWQSGEVSIEEDAPAPVTPAPPACGPELDRLEDIVRKQQRLLQRQLARIRELERDLDGQRRINVRLNQMLKGMTR